MAFFPVINLIQCNLLIDSYAELDSVSMQPLNSNPAVVSTQSYQQYHKIPRPNPSNYTSYASNSF